MRLRRGARRRLDRRGRRRRELARAGRLDAGAGLAGAGEPGADPGHGGRGAGAEHRRLRAGAEGPLRVARRGRPGHRPQRHARPPRSAPSATATACSSIRWPAAALITRVRFRLPRPWQPVLGYLDLERKMRETGIAAPDAAAGVRLGLRDPPRQAARPGADRQRRQLLQEPGGHARAVPRHHRPRPGDRALPDARRQREAGRRLDDRRLRLEGQDRSARPAVYEKQALVLVNRGGAIGSEVMTLARAIQESVYGRFGIRLEPEPVVV